MTHPGSAIRAMRTAQDLTGRELAARSGTAPSYLSLVERGRRVPSADWLWRVAGALAEKMREGAGSESLTSTSGGSRGRLC